MWAPVPFTVPTVVAVMCLWFFSWVGLGRCVVRLARVARLDTSDPLAASALALAADCAALTLCLCVVCLVKARFRLPPPWFSLLPARLGWRAARDAALSVLLFYPIGELIETCAWAAQELAVEPLGTGGGPAAHACYGLLVVVVTPVWEELLFRGFLLPALTRAMPTVAAVVVSALVFAVAHMSAVRALPLALLGAMLGTLCVRHGGGLAMPIAMHALWNLYGCATQRRFE